MTPPTGRDHMKWCSYGREHSKYKKLWKQQVLLNNLLTPQRNRSVGISSFMKPIQCKWEIREKSMRQSFAVWTHNSVIHYHEIWLAQNIQMECQAKLWWRCGHWPSVVRGYNYGLRSGGGSMWSGVWLTVFNKLKTNSLLQLKADF